MTRLDTLRRLDDLRVDAEAKIAAADMKATALLGWDGTVFAIVTGFLATGGRLPAPAALPAGVGVATLCASVVALLAAVRPRLGGPANDRSFLHLADLSPGDVVDLVKGDNDDSSAANAGIGLALASARVVLVARIARRKHQLVRLATTLLLVSMPALALAALVGVSGWS